MKLRIPNLELYNGMPDDTLISSKEVAVVFGYKYATAKEIPPPVNFDTRIFRKGKWGDYRRRFGHSLPRNNRIFWVLGDLRKLKQEREMIR